MWTLGTPTLNMISNTTKQLVKWSLILVSVLHSGWGDPQRIQKSSFEHYSIDSVYKF